MKISRLGFGIFKLLLFGASLAAVSVARSDCTLATTGNIPLPDLGPGLYKGYEGGLYPNGTSIPPAAHAAAGLTAAAQIQPLNAAGQPDPNGTIVFTSLGISNATRCWLTDGPTAFMPRANADPSKNSKVTLVDGAQGRKDAVDWSNPADPAWQVFQERLAAAGLTAAQVQVAWTEFGLKFPATIGPFPKHAQVFQAGPRADDSKFESGLPESADSLHFHPRTRLHRRSDGAQPGAVRLRNRLRGEVDDRRPD